MTLQEINKVRYRKHLNIVIVGFIATFALLSVGLGSTLIAIFSPENEAKLVSVFTQPSDIAVATHSPAVMPNTSSLSSAPSSSGPSVTTPSISAPEGRNTVSAKPQSNFRYNLAGVVIALVCCGALLSSLKRREFFTEIYYVWQLKQIHNQIYRRLASIKKASKNEDEKALVVLNYYYTSLLQVYELDDNTLVNNKVQQDLTAINDEISRLQLTVDTSAFDQSLIKLF